MADFADPYDVMSTNPYLQMMQPQQPHWTQVLGNALLGVGAGISQADASGRGWASGVGPGLAYGTQMLAHQRQQAEQDAMKRWQLGMMAQEYADKHQDRVLKRNAMEAAARELETPGMRVPPSTAGMGPGSYDTKVAGLEGGQRNGGMVFNELGSGAFGPYQFMPATWQAVRAQNPNLNLPADITQATREQHDQAHNAFKAGNAQALQAAGFQPTPDNLYLAHRFGAGGAISVLKADPNQSLAEVLPIDWQRQNPDMRGQTAGGFRRLAGERVGGVGVPYEVPANAKPTPYALQPDSLPDFNIPGGGVMSLNPRANPAPSWAAPVMPQPQAPQATMTPAQFTPPSPAPAVAPSPAPEAPPKLVLPPKPELPDAEAVRISRALRSGTMTPAEARAEKNKIENDLWNAQKDEAKARYQQESENYRFNRGEATKKDVWRPLTAEERQKVLPGASPDAQLQINDRTGEIKPVMSARDVHREAGYRLAPDGVSLEFIPGGPADPEVIRRTSDVKRATAEKMIPQTVTKGMQENVDALKQIDRALTALKARPDSVGGVGSTAASMIPGVANLQNRFGDPEGTQLRALIADIGSLKIHDRSGAAVTASEFPRLRPFIPSISDDPKTVETKLNNFRAVYDQTLRDATEYYGADNGFKPYTPATSYLDGTAAPSAQPAQPDKPAAAQAKAPPAPGFTKDGYRFKGGDPSQRMNWEPVK